MNRPGYRAAPLQKGFRKVVLKGPRIAGLILIPVLLLAACRQPAPATDRVKIGIEADGLYRLTAADLRPVGFDLAAADPARLRLSNRGRVVPLRLSGRGRDLAVEFYATGVDTRYTGTNVYWLDVAGRPADRLATRAVSPPAAPDTSTQATARFEWNAVYWSKEGLSSDDRWYWQSLVAPATVTLPFTLSHRVEGLGRLGLLLAGANRAVRSPNHRVEVRVNGEHVGEAAWDGQTEFELSAELPAGLLRDENRLELVARETPGQPDVVLLNRFGVTYPRALVADENTLFFDGEGGGYQAAGFSGSPIEVLDVTDPLSATLLSGAIPAGGDGRGVAFADDGSRRYLAVGPGAARRPAWVAAGPAVDLRAASLGADTIIITHPSLLEPVKRLATWRQSQGLRVVTVTTDEVYDAFSDGLVDPAAIREFLRHARAAWAPPAPRFVLLAGDASYDYRDYLAGSNRSLVPTMMLPTTFLSEAPSDNWLVALDEGSALPSLAAGRLPARTAAELAVAVDKIIAYEEAPPAGDWRRRLLFVADDKEARFAQLADELADGLPAEIASERIYLGAIAGEERGQTARARIVSAFGRGALAVTYAGHGAVRSWAQESIFDAEDAAALKNGGRLPLLITPTCLNGYFAHPTEDSLAEVLLWQRGGGIIAGFVPTGLTLPEGQEALMRGFFDALFSRGLTVGEAVVEAKRGLPSGGQDVKDVIETFAVLGDPALRVGGALTPNPSPRGRGEPDSPLLPPGEGVGDEGGADPPLLPPGEGAGG